MGELSIKAKALSGESSERVSASVRISWWDILFGLWGTVDSSSLKKSGRVLISSDIPYHH
jgi:hypothetical protein